MAMAARKTRQEHDRHPFYLPDAGCLEVTGDEPAG